MSEAVISADNSGVRAVFPGEGEDGGRQIIGHLCWIAGAALWKASRRTASGLGGWGTPPVFVRPSGSEHITVLPARFHRALVRFFATPSPFFVRL
jgi:hypothetical protein